MCIRLVKKRKTDQLLKNYHGGFEAGLLLDQVIMGKRNEEIKDSELQLTCPNSSFRSEVFALAGMSDFSSYIILSQPINIDPINF